ncbi:MAG: hypothetical protein K5924_12855, partial [Chloroflexi bacterium]|nr:hypothetical protein [Chloroflexota bacterium]
AVIVVPPTNVLAKTATLYGSLRVEDYGTHQQIEEALAEFKSENFSSITNSFTRAALEAFPETRTARDVMEHVTGTSQLSGAGPAIYSLTTDLMKAKLWAEELRARLPTDHFVETVSMLSSPPTPEILQ